MKLQVALDLLELKDAIKIARKVRNYVDIIEAGTPLIKSEGIKVVKALKKFGKPVLADMKTMDTGFLEAELAFKAGADIATVCGAASDVTIKNAISAAKRYKKKIIVDLLSVKNPVKRAKEVLEFGASYVCFHRGIDEWESGIKLSRELKRLSKVESKRVAIAGGINLENIEKVVKLKPKIIIVGSAITKAKNPEKIAKELKRMLK